MPKKSVSTKVSAETKQAIEDIAWNKRTSTSELLREKAQEIVREEGQ